MFLAGTVLVMITQTRRSGNPRLRDLATVTNSPSWSSLPMTFYGVTYNLLRLCCNAALKD